jgi:anthranilate synthase component 1
VKGHAFIANWWFILKISEFRTLAESHRVIPVTRTLIADGETPLSIYRKVANERPGTFLLESAENGALWSRYSFIGARCVATLTEDDGVAVWRGRPPEGVPEGIDPLEALRITVERLRTPRLPGQPPLTGGMVGYLGYDAVRRLEKLPNLATDDLQIPELSFMLVGDLVVFDHLDAKVVLIANAINWDGSDERVDEAFAEAISRLDRMEDDLHASLPGSASAIVKDDKPQYRRWTDSNTHIANVELIKEEIRKGEAFQVVLSQRFSMPCEASALDVYRMLRLSNPSPYMYLLRFEDGIDIVGSSPEALVKVVDGQVLLHPIAGTRRRGADADEDAELAAELLADPKERAEHLMLVDLGRNDLGRVCTPGSVEVVDFMKVERYSHVMHIVSSVVGKVSTGKTSFDVLTATFPAGTLSGAPKPRAMEIIETLEPTRRGLYGGAIGYLDFAGDLDAAIAIRTALIRDGVAYVQAGGGIVADSDPSAEDQECQNKAAAVLGAIATANLLTRLRGS